MIYPIRYYGDPILRQKARPVTQFDDDLKQLAQDMLETLYDASGIGLAAPQIGIPKRLFIAIHTASNETKEAPEVDAPEIDENSLSPEEKRKLWGVVEELIMVNPEILSREGVQYGADGCLSLPGVWVDEIRRDDLIRVRYQDLEGELFERSFSGRFSHVIQHEYDHLEGILFFDRLDNKEKFMKKNRQELADIQREAKYRLKELKRR
ncbi:MAG: peptide deformylase [Deinococcales bacterium]